MRPLVVLLLVLGSLAALIFALTALTDSGRSGEEGRGQPVAAAPTRPDRPAELPQATPVGETAEGAAPQGEPTRTALQPDLEPNGSKVSFGAIEGTVIDREGLPIAGAEVGLLNSKP